MTRDDKEGPHTGVDYYLQHTYIRSKRNKNNSSPDRLHLLLYIWFKIHTFLRFGLNHHRAMENKRFYTQQQQRQLATVTQ